MKKILKKDRLLNTNRAIEIVKQLSLEEKIYLMSGPDYKSINMEQLKKDMKEGKIHYNIEPYLAGGIEKFKIPALAFCDGPRGVVCGKNQTTCFPVSMLRGASFDVDLEEKIGAAIGKEIRAFGGNYFGGVCINLPYNPGWGRSQETYGEESFALGQMGSALVRGVQEQAVMACVKHYAFNSMEISRFEVDIECDRRTEREVFLPHFKDCIDAGAASVMCSYNLYKGIPVSASDYLQRKILKEEWDFDGFIISDFIQAVRSTTGAANGSLDIEMPAEIHFGKKLIQAVKDGLVPEKYIDEAATRIIRTILTFEDAYTIPIDKKVLACKEHVDLALKAAQEGITLLKNKNDVLPLNKEKIKSLLILGSLADKGNTGDDGSSKVYSENIVTPVEGFKKIAPNLKITYYDGNDLKEASKLAKENDHIIFIVGYDKEDEGEYILDWGDKPIGGDREIDLRLHKEDVELIKIVSQTNQNSTVVLNGGNTILMNEWMDDVNSIIMAYYSGQEGGTALAQIIFGEVNPSGKLPFVLPNDEKDLPQVKWKTTNQFYEYYHGYARLEKNNIKPLLPYGFGLSYTEFKYDNLVVNKNSENLEVSCSLENIGKKEGKEVVQLYIGFKNSKIDRPVKLLRGFKKVNLKPGEKTKVIINCPIEKIKYFNSLTSTFELEHMSYEIYIGPSSDEQKLLKNSIEI